MEANMTKVFRQSVLTLSVFFGLLTGLPAQAQEVTITGPLAGAPSVMHMRIYREGRFQIKLQGAMTLQDEFTRSIIFGGQLQYNLTDWLGIGVWGGFAPIHLDTGLTDEVNTRGAANERNVLSLPNKKLFPNQIGKILYIAAPQVEFTPLRGKLGLFEKVFVDTDFFLFGGVAFIGVEERADVLNKSTCSTVPPSAACTPASQNARSSRMAIGPTFGVGLSMYLAEFLAMSIEWRAFPFAWNTSGTDESGSTKGTFPDGIINSSDRLFHFNHLVGLGFSFFLPTTPGISYTGE
jgi:outer membrane beta-barrel protein